MNLDPTEKLPDQGNALAGTSPWDASPYPWSDFSPCSPKNLRAILEGLHAAPRKRWGQNFLIDLAAQERIVQAAEIEDHECVWEIGLGLGALTQHLWRSCTELILFEIDPILLQFYRSRLSGTRCCQLIPGDVIKTWRSSYQRAIPDVVIGNLPYNTASLIMNEFSRETAFRPRCMVFTVQKEMAERLTAKERSKPYSSFSVLLQSQFQIQCLFDLPPQLFYPKPNVISSSIRLTPRSHGLSPNQAKELERFTRTIFRQRRKTIANNLKSCHYKEDLGELESKLEEVGIHSSQRAEEISIEHFLALARSFPIRRCAQQNLQS